MLQVLAGAMTREALKKQIIDRTGMGGVIGHATATNYTGDSGTIFSGTLWRVDRQNPSKTHANLQVQRNGIFGEKSSVAGVLIPLDLAAKIGGINAPGVAGVAAKARAAELTRAIHKALTESAGTWQYVPNGQAPYAEYRVYSIQGTFSA